MARAIDILMDEHFVILRVLGSLETFVVKMDRGIESERASLGDYVTFLHNFADKCHHGKEEDILFERMLSYGFPAKVGPLAVMRHQHALGREHLSALACVTQGSGPLSKRERETVRNHAVAYVDLLRTHIVKENNLLYPMALAAIPGSEMETLAADFDKFEEQEMSPGRHERLHVLADHLVAVFPSDPTNASPGPGCCGRG